MVKGRAVRPWKMASEPGMLNDEAARDLPIQRQGIKAIAVVPHKVSRSDSDMKLGGNTKYLVPFRERDFFIAPHFLSRRNSL